MSLYYPKVELVTTKTRFGMLQVNHPTLYDTPIKDKRIIKVNVFKQLPDIIKSISGFEIKRIDFYEHHDYFLELLEGNCTSERFAYLLAHLSALIPEFRTHVLYCYEFCYSEYPHFYRVIKPIREKLDYVENEVYELIMAKARTKYIMKHNDIMYFSVPDYTNLSALNIPYEEVRG